MMHGTMNVKKSKAISIQEAEVIRFRDNRHMKVVRLSALRSSRLYPPGDISGTHFSYRQSRPQGCSTAGRIIPMENSSDTIRNQTRGLAACAAVIQSTTPLRAPICVSHQDKKWVTSDCHS